MVPSAREVDLRLLARSIGEKKLRMATLKEAESMTGLKVGGISALALWNRGFQVCIDRAAQGVERIHISAGARGIDLELSVGDLIAVTRAQLVDATE
jgi:Cys-tRNA(Pro)/Cys-tRNA(Cys) deacylase